MSPARDGQALPSSTAPATTTPTTGGTSNAACAVTPSATVGPYPSVTDLFRSDIREDRSGTPLSLSRGQNPTSNTGDMVFADSVNSELATVSGDPAGGMSATFQVAITA